MKRSVAILLSMIFILSLSFVLFSCTKKENEYIPPVEIEKEVGVLPTELKNEIENCWKEEIGYGFLWFSKNNYDGMRYYGTYNGYAILVKTHPNVIHGTMIIADIFFDFNISLTIYAFKNGFYNLDIAYKEQMVSREDIIKIQKIHNKYTDEINKSLLEKDIGFSDFVVKTPELPSFLKNQIDAERKKNGDDPIIWYYDNPHIGWRYYGIYRGYAIIFAPTSLTAYTIKRIGGCQFCYGNCFDILAYKDGKYQKLEDLYDNQDIYNCDIEKIAKIHKNYEEGIRNEKS